MTEDHTLIVLHEPPLIGPGPNRDAWQSYFSSFPDFVIHPRHLAGSGTSVAVLGSTTGSHLGLPDEEEMRLDVVWLAEAATGRLSLWQIAEDTAELRARVGIPRKG